MDHVATVSKDLYVILMNSPTNGSSILICNYLKTFDIVLIFGLCPLLRETAVPMESKEQGSNIILPTNAPFIKT